MHRKIALVKALNKVIWIQNDLMAKWHVREAEEFGLLESAVVTDKEGYLHGKKMLDDSMMNDADTGLPTAMHVDEPKKSECPFSSSLPIIESASQSDDVPVSISAGARDQLKGS
jgi:hypothetical protein